MSENSREKDVLISVYYSLMELQEKGFVKGGSMKLSKKGLDRAKHLRSIGFSPTEKEVEMAMETIQQYEIEKASS